MKKICFYLVVLGSLVSCKKDKIHPIATSAVIQPVITSAEYIDSLLFVNKNGYQIQTTDTGATFNSTDPHIKMTPRGLITRLTSAEVVPIQITWKNLKFHKTTIYALGATDNNQDMPFLHFQGALATDPYASYLLGWKTLQKLPISGETYAIVLRHADASYGSDHPFSTIPNWWKSTDSVVARQLNLQGFQRAADLGQIFKDLQYPIKRVYTSEFNRSIQTAAIINAGPVPIVDSSINHPTHNLFLPGLFTGMTGILAKLPVDNQMSLIVSHHPINELGPVTGYPSFPVVSPFNWTGAYLIKIEGGGGLTCKGAVSWAMFKLWRDMKLHK